MPLIRKYLAVASLILAALASRSSHAQAVPTASANVRVSAFAGVSGNETGLESARNADITAGIDIGLRPFHGFYPAVEGRGMYPVARGQLVSVQDLLAGVRVGRHYNRLMPYADALFGRALLKYANGGLPDSTGTLYYLQNTSNALSVGAGVDWDWTAHLGFKADVQVQQYNSPVVTTGKLDSKIVTVGVVYRLGFSRIK